MKKLTKSATPKVKRPKIIRPKITLVRVQKEFNAMVCRLGKVCRVTDGSPCSGGLQCSHFFPVGGNGGLRYYPFNAFPQCAGHHFSHHQRNPLFYAEFMQDNYPEELEWMESVRRNPLRYTHEVLRTILSLCVHNKVWELRDYIRSLYVAESR